VQSPGTRNVLHPLSHKDHVMKQPLPLFALLALVVIGACIAGCTSNAPATCPAAIAETKTVPSTPAGMGTNISPHFLYVQESSSGSFEPAGNGTYTLTLDSVVPYTIYLSDRPDRTAGFTHMDYYITGFDWSVAPDAAISRPGAKESEDTLIVNLSAPRYNSSARQLIYTATALNNYQGDTLAGFVTKADPALPRDLGKVRVFIDSSSGVTCPEEFLRCPSGECVKTLGLCPTV